MILAIDIGGSSVKTALWKDGKISDKKYFKSPNNWDEMFRKINESIKYYKKSNKIEGIAFGVPGIPNYITGKVDGASSLKYIHEPEFLKAFEEEFKIPVSFENDANCACIAEINHESLKDKKHMVFVVIGTGIGGSIVYDRKIQNGAHSFGGEFGMMLVDGRNEWAILGSAVHMGRKVSELKGEELTGVDVFNLAETGDETSKKAVEELFHYLALGIYNLQYIIDPEIIVLGGGITGKENLVDEIEKEMDKIMEYGQRSPLYPKIVKANYGNDANLIGAGYHFMEIYGKN